MRLAEGLRSLQIRSLEAKAFIYGDEKLGQSSGLEQLKNCSGAQMGAPSQDKFVFETDFLSYFSNYSEIKKNQEGIAKRIAEIRQKNQELFAFREVLEKDLSACEAEKQKRLKATILKRENSFGFSQKGKGVLAQGFMPELELFFLEARKKGVTLAINDIEIEEKNQIVCGEKGHNLYGCCKKRPGQTPKIEIQKDKWKTLSSTNRLRVLSHELGHCLFNFSHPENSLNEVSLMHSPFKPLLEEEFKKHQDEYFEEYFKNLPANRP